MRPMLHDCIVVVPAEGGAIIDGLKELEQIKGVASETLLPLILPMLDGSKTFEEIKSQLSQIPGNTVEETLNCLAEWNLLRDDDEQSHVVSGPTKAMLERYDLSFGLARRGQSSLSLLASCSVSIGVKGVGELEWLRRGIGERLCACGVGQVSMIGYQPKTHSCGQWASVTLKHDPVKGTPHDGSQVQVFIGTGGSPGCLRIGPVIRTQTDGCLACCNSFFDDGDPPTTFFNGIQKELALSFLVLEIVHLILNVPTALGRNRIREIELEDATSKTLYFPCHSIMGYPQGHNTSGLLFDLASVYNDRVSGEPQYVATEEIRYAVEAARRTGSEYAAASALPLPREDVNLGASVVDILLRKRWPKTRGLSVSLFAALGSFAVGLKKSEGDKVVRWCPSAGNAGSARLHLLTTDIENVPGGLYSYDAHTHQLLDRYSLAGPPYSSLLDGLLGTRHGAVTLLILTARRDFLVNKYREFSYKLCNLDAGVAMAQLSLIAGACGMAVIPHSGWPDDMLTSALNLRQTNEHVTAVLSVNRRTIFKKPKRDTSLSDSAIFVESKMFRDQTLASLTEALIATGRFIPGTGSERRPRIAKPRSLDRESLIPLERMCESATSVAEALDSRSSVREFDGLPVTSDKIHSILHAGWSNDRSDWLRTDECGVPLDFTLLMRVNESEAHTVYRYLPRYSALQRLKSNIPTSQVQECFVQSEFANAPITVLIHANVWIPAGGMKPPSYRLLLLRAGAAAHRMWLMGVALGLVGTVQAGLNQGAIRSILGGHGQVLIGCSLGHKQQMEGQ